MTKEEMIMEVEKIRERRYVDYTVQSQHAIEMAIKALEAMDNTQNTLQRVGSVERPEGHWIGVERLEDRPSYKWYRCSECEMLVESKVNFCPNCGADMRGERNE